MNIAPILRREMLEQARRPGTRWLRVFGAAMIIFLCWRAIHDDGTLLRSSGRPLFQGLNKLLFLLIWLVAPLMTADCLSREKREGTIGLLFLTPLRPGEVIAGKVFVHALRGLTIIVAAFPILALPVLVGGVTLADAVRMLLFHISALGVALTTGVLASALTHRAGVARLLAFVFAASGALLFMALYVTSVTVALWRSNPALQLQISYPELWVRQLIMLVRIYGLGGGAFNPFSRWAAGGGGSWVHVAYGAAVAVGGALLVAAAGWFAAYGLKKTWRPQSIGGDQPRFAKWRLKRAVSGKAARARQLDRNPFCWLEARHHPWPVWIAVGAAAGFLGESWLGFAPRWLERAAMIVGFSLMAALTLRKEQEDGRMEMIAVTPLPLSLWYWERYRRVLLASFITATTAMIIDYLGIARQLLAAGKETAWEGAGLWLPASLVVLLWFSAMITVAFAGAVRGRPWWFSTLLAVGIYHAFMDLVPSIFKTPFRLYPALEGANYFLSAALVLGIALKLSFTGLQSTTRPP
jgi:ABC-type transport system involved in multi-copper enzyme maturation permease subunit